MLQHAGLYLVSLVMDGNSIVVNSCDVCNEYNVALHDRIEASTDGKVHMRSVRHCGELCQSYGWRGAQVLLTI